MTKAAQPLNSPSLLVVVIAGTVTVFFLIAIVREFIQSRNIHQQLGRLESNVVNEEQRQKELQDLLTYLSSPTFQERQARLELGLKGEGERVIVVPETPSDGVVTEAESVETAALNNPTKWWRYFFGLQKKVQ